MDFVIYAIAFVTKISASAVNCVQLVPTAHLKRVMENLITVTSPHNLEPNARRNEAEQFTTTLKCHIRADTILIRKVFDTEFINENITNPENVRALSQFFEIKNSFYYTL